MKVWIVMEELDSSVPLPETAQNNEADLGGVKRIGIAYNLKKDTVGDTADSQAEYDSIDTIKAIKQALERAGYTTELLEADEQFPERVKQAKVDMVFNIAEGLRGRGREAQVPALLSMLNIPYTGSDETTLCIALDKALTKRILTTYHVPTPHYSVVGRNGTVKADNLTFPVIVKPNAEGSSKGISDVSIVENSKALHALCRENIRLYKQDMLLEEYVKGREFTVGLLGNGDNVRVFSPMEIIYKRPTQGNYCVYSYNVKLHYKEEVDYMCPAKLDSAIESEIRDVAKRVFIALGCRDLARVDFRLSESGKPYFIEINPLPGLTPSYSDYPELAQLCGVGYDELIVSILREAIKRYGK